MKKPEIVVKFGRKRYPVQVELMPRGQTQPDFYDDDSILLAEVWGVYITLPLNYPETELKKKLYYNNVYDNNNSIGGVMLTFKADNVFQHKFYFDSFKLTESLKSTPLLPEEVEAFQDVTVKLFCYLLFVISQEKNISFNTEVVLHNSPIYVEKVNLDVISSQLKNNIPELKKRILELKPEAFDNVSRFTPIDDPRYLFNYLYLELLADNFKDVMELSRRMGRDFGLPFDEEGVKKDPASYIPSYIMKYEREKLQEDNFYEVYFRYVKNLLLSYNPESKFSYDPQFSGEGEPMTLGQLLMGCR